MNRFDIINRIGDKYRVGNTETGEFSYAQALKTVGKDIKDYQKATTGTQHKFLDIRFENERLVVLVECKNKFSRWDKAKIQGQLQDYVSDWESFCASDIFFLYNGSGITKEEIEDNPGSFPAVQSGADNNGCIGYISKDYCKAMNYTYVEEPCLTVARTGSAGFVAFQPYGCVVGDSAKILLLKNTEHRKPAVYLFLRTILMANQYKYTYGRKVTEDKYLSETLLLPSVDSITPDWASMEKYILSLHHKPLKTAITEQTPSELNTKTWHEFFLHRILICSMGNGIDAVITTSDEPKYNYVSRDSNGNGVVGFVDEIEGEEPFPAGAMSLALGGSFLGSCFIQKKPFYTAQNVAVLQEKVPLSDHTKLFIATLIRNECKIKYQAFGRELNAHFRKDFTIKLPVKRNADGIVFDETHEFSDDGYIPDWEWMDSYMRSLPYSDRLQTIST